MDLMPQYSVVNLLYLHHEGCSHKIGCHKPRMSCVILKAINSILQIKKFVYALLISHSKSQDKKMSFGMIMKKFYNFNFQPPAIFKYSDFEAESDPFDRAELQTLDDLRILAT